MSFLGLGGFAFGGSAQAGQSDDVGEVRALAAGRGDDDRPFLGRGVADRIVGVDDLEEVEHDLGVDFEHVGVLLILGGGVDELRFLDGLGVVPFPDRLLLPLDGELALHNGDGGRVALGSQQAEVGEAGALEA